MKNWKNLALIALLAASVAACKNTPTTPKTQATDVDFKAMATEMCQCSPAMMDNISKVLTAQQAGKDAEVAKLVAESEAIGLKYNECLQKVADKYGKVINNDPRAFDALKTNCPELVKMMEWQQKLMQSAAK